MLYNQLRSQHDDVDVNDGDYGDYDDDDDHHPGLMTKMMMRVMQ